MISRLIGSVAVPVAVLLALAGCALGSGPERLRTFDIGYTVNADVNVHVIETID